MKKAIRFIIISLAPIAILAYPNLYLLARAYSGIHDRLPILIAFIAGYALIGAAIFFICKNSLMKTDTLSFPAEFLVGILLGIFPVLSIFIGISLPMFFFPEMGTGISLTGLSVGVYICLFITVLRRRAKALKEEKTIQIRYEP